MKFSVQNSQQYGTTVNKTPSVSSHRVLFIVHCITASIHGDVSLYHAAQFALATNYERIYIQPVKSLLRELQQPAV